jgi:hypothetical protein
MAGAVSTVLLGGGFGLMIRATRKNTGARTSAARDGRVSCVVALPRLPQLMGTWCRRIRG